MTTEVGHISGMLNVTKDEVTPLTRQLNALTNQILVIAGVALLISIGIGLWRNTPIDELFLTAIAFAVSAIPTGLPAVVTAILSRGTTTLASAGAIVKRLRSVETLGSTSAINSDKTGTLTLNQMTAVQMAVVHGRYAITGEGYSTEGQITHVGGQVEGPLDSLMLPMALCADAEIRDGGLVGDPTEGALVVLAAKGGVDPTLTRERYPRVATLPFDAAYKFMATFHRMTDDKGKEVIRAYVKGAPDQLLGRAKSAQGTDGQQYPIDQVREPYLTENDRLGAQGLRVLATAQRDFDPKTFDPNADLLPLIADLRLLALVGIVDPPRIEARDAITKAHSAGIQVRMITGDHAITAGAIASQLGIKGQAITGAEFAAMSDDEADRRIDDIGVIARVAPEDKVRLVEILRRKGHIVAMTGDGVNDAPALKAADIGVAMGITGTEVSKEAAVMILTDDNFATIVGAVEQGRALVRQPHALHPLPDGEPVRLHQHVPGGEHLQRPRRRPVPAAPDPLDQLHRHRLPGGRPRLQQAAVRPHERQATTQGRADPAAPAVHLAGLRGPRLRDRDPAADRLGGGRLRRDRRAHDGARDVLAAPRLLLAGDGRRGADDLQQPAAGEPDPAQGVRPVAADGLPRDDVRTAPAAARHDRAVADPVGDLHRPGGVDPGDHRGPEAVPPSERRAGDRGTGRRVGARQPGVVIGGRPLAGEATGRTR